MRATQACIRLDNLAYNIAAVRRQLTGGTRICMPVKADAYGHGATPVAKTALQEGVSFLAVATVEEGAELRAAGIRAPILLFSPALPDEWEAAAAAHLTPFISDVEEAAAFARAVKRLSPSAKQPVFLAIDTGMGREGCAPKGAAELARAIVEAGPLALRGTATHLSEAEDAAWTETQLARFRDALQAVRDAGIEPGIISAANSAAFTAYENARFDLVRPGIMLYGCEDTHLKPVMEFRTKIARIKKIAAGDPVSYGRTWTATRDTYIGVLPVGYADGLPRALSREGGRGGGGLFCRRWRRALSACRKGVHGSMYDRFRAVAVRRALRYRNAFRGRACAARRRPCPPLWNNILRNLLRHKPPRPPRLRNAGIMTSIMGRRGGGQARRRKPVFSAAWRSLCTAK